MSYDAILTGLLEKIKERDGEDRLTALQSEIKENSMEGLKREMILQILERETPTERERFLRLHPELRAVYQQRIR